MISWMYVFLVPNYLAEQSLSLSLLGFYSPGKLSVLSFINSLQINLYNPYYYHIEQLHDYINSFVGKISNLI